MNNSESSKIGLWSLVMLIFVPTFGFGNITTNAVALGPASIPSWIIVSILFFLPLSAMMAEFASADSDKGGGIYSWINTAIGPKWAFIGTWSYFIANLFYLQMIFSRIPVMMSWAIFGENRFTDAHASLVPYLGAIFAILLTWIATKGVKKFSKLSSFGGKFTIAATVLFIIFAIIGLIIGKPSATPFTKATVIPKFDVNYFSTFAWLLFSVAGAEVAGTYIKQVDNPRKTFPKAVVLATIFVAVAYVIGSYAVCLVISPDALSKAGLKDANYVVYQLLGNSFGINGKLVVQAYACILTITSIAAYVIWLESPIRAMFSDVPEGTFPSFLTKKNSDETLINALWCQLAIVLILIITPAVGLNSLNNFFTLITNLSSLSLVLPYIILAFAYLCYRQKGNKAPYTMFKSKAIACTVSFIVLILGIAGFFGAGISDVVGADTSYDALIAVIKDYGGPIILIILGYLLTYLTKLFSKNKASQNNSTLQ